MKAFLALVAGAGLAACSSNPQLMNIAAGNNGPDEFAIVPSKPLQMPADLNNLPLPTPGGSNLTDPTPLTDAVVALGGNPARVAGPGADTGLLTYTARFGREPDIRARLAAEDLDWRSRHGRRLLETLARTNVYLRAYEDMALDQQAELTRWRRAGARTPSAPPK